MFTFTSRQFYDQWTSSGGGSVNYLNSCQGDKITCVMEGYFYWAVTNQKFTIAAASKTITIYVSPVNGQPQTYGFLANGFTAGDTFDLVGSGSNDGSYTVESVTDRAITTVEALIDETVPSASVYGTTPITAVDFLYNLVENKAQVDFASQTDVGTVQRYTATGLDATVATPVYLTPDTDSFGWVPDILSGDTSTESFIEGQMIVDYKQKFKITHVFRQTSIWNKTLVNNFANRQIPDDFLNDKHLRYVCQVNGRYNDNDPFVNHTGVLAPQNGAGAWFNQSPKQGRNEYSIASIEYKNFDTSEIITRIDGSIVTLVTMVINSRSGKFVANNSRFLLSHFQCPMDQAEYSNTFTTLLQNIKQDEAFATSDAVSPIDGINFGTDYQSITNVMVLNLSANQVVITFRVDYSADTKTYLSNKGINDRYYAICVECQDDAITTTKGIDRVNVICDFNLSDYDLREDNIFGLLDYFHCFPFPKWGYGETNDVNAYEGDPCYVEIPFWVETAIVANASPTLKNMTVQVVSTKSGETDFVLEEKIFDTSTVRKLNDKQTIDIENIRGFILETDSPWNHADVIRYPAGDLGSKIAYKIRYAFIMRYEYWINAIQVADQGGYDIAKFIENPTEQWKQYSIGYGWALKLRLNAQVEGYSGFITSFTGETSINILTAGDVPQAGPTFITGAKYYTESGEQVTGIMKDAKTRIVAGFKGEVGTFPGGTTEYWGYMFEVDPEAGSIFTQRIAFSDIDSESDSPFSSADLPANQSISWYSSNSLRISRFDNRIELDTWYTDFSSLKGITAKPILIGNRLGHKNSSILLQENGSAILQEDGSKILL